LDANTAEVMLVKLRTGENLIAMVEFKDDEEGSVVLYNPMRLLSTKFPVAGTTKTSILMSEWLPREVVSEQMATVFEDEIVTVVPVNYEFRNMYEAMIMRKVSLDEIARKNAETDPLRTISGILEEDEEELEESLEESQEALKKFKGGNH
jgi:hypothetical protein